MGLEFKYAKDPGSGNEVVATARLCLTDENTLVPENHPKGRRLFCIPGDRVPRDQAEKLGMLKGRSSTDTPPVDTKAVRKWAAEQKIAVPKTGRLPQDVIDAYAKANETE